MPWFKVDDDLHSHPKARRVGLASLGLWVVSGSYSMSYKTDGFVPEWFVNGWPNGRRYAHTLADSGLWEPAEQDGEKGWLFHDWADYQPLSDEIEADRDKARERQRKRRARLRGETNKEVTPDVTPDVTRDSQDPVPSRPVPSQKTTSSGAAKPPRRKPETPLPDDWKPNAKHAAQASEAGLTLSDESFRFRNNALTNDRRARDWDAAFRVWLSKSKDFGPQVLRRPADVRPEPKALPRQKCPTCNAPQEITHYDDCPDQTWRPTA